MVSAYASSGGFELSVKTTYWGEHDFIEKRLAATAARRMRELKLNPGNYNAAPGRCAGPVCRYISEAGLSLAGDRIDVLGRSGIGRRRIGYNQPVEYVLEIGPDA